MNNISYPYIQYQIPFNPTNINIQEELINIKKELAKINEKLNNLENKNKYEYIQNEQDMYMLSTQKKCSFFI